MNVRFLIDRLVNLQAGLLAEVATSGGVRAPLAELADQSFIHLANELDRRGISRKVSSDMFGMALRAYLKKIQRLAKSSTENGSSLWQSVVDYLHAEGSVTRSQVLQRFCRDEESQLRAVLHDLAESGLVTVKGSGPQALYQLVELETAKLTDTSTFAELVWLTIFRDGPIGKEQLFSRANQRNAPCDEALALLVESGRVTVVPSETGLLYQSRRFEIPVGQEGGWEAAILDHYQAMVRTIIGVLPGLSGTGATGPEVGGYTYSLDIWPGHPLKDEVLGTIQELRNKLSDLRRRVDAYNESIDLPEQFSEVRIYGGQSMSPRSETSKSTLPPAPHTVTDQTAP